jgi:rhomboid protease GluP
MGDSAAYLARGASLTQRDALDASWRLLASTFLHSGPGHLLFNAAAMLVYGPAVERIFTRSGFWIVFAAGGAAASLASLAWRLSRYGIGPHLSIGASGAIFALGGAVLVSAIRLRGRLAPGRARALGAAILFLMLPALAGGFQKLGTDNAAHAGGLIAGALLGAILPLNPRLVGTPVPVAVRVLGWLMMVVLAICLARVLVGE